MNIQEFLEKYPHETNIVKNVLFKHFFNNIISNFDNEKFNAFLSLAETLTKAKNNTLNIPNLSESEVKDIETFVEYGLAVGLGIQERNSEMEEKLTLGLAILAIKELAHKYSKKDNQ